MRNRFNVTEKWKETTVILFYLLDKIGRNVQ